MSRCSASLKHSNFEVFLAGKDFGNYTWGTVTEVFKIGEYGILKYISSYDKDDVNKVRFHPFIWTNKYPEHHNNEWYWSDTNTSFYSLEAAIIGAITKKYEGSNSQAGSYFCKMIGIE